MNCTHPVLYSRDCVLYCQICGAVLPPDVLQRKPQAQEEKAAKTQKKPVKRKTAKIE